jgi:hypothetical protein
MRLQPFVLLTLVRLIRTPVAGLVALCLIGCGGGPSTPNKTVLGQGTHKIVGEWGFVKASNDREPEWGTTMEFSADGKVALRGPGYANAGKYTVDENTLTFTAGLLNEKLAIVKLTDKELVLEQRAVMNTVRLEYRRK